MKNKLLEELEIEVKKLELKKGDVVVIKDGTNRIIPQDEINDISKMIQGNDIIVLNNETSIGSVPEKEMNDLGWYKKEDKDKEEIIYQLSINDIQHVAESTIGRYLTHKEIEKIKRKIGDYFTDWHEKVEDAIENEIIKDT